MDQQIQKLYESEDMTALPNPTQVDGWRSLFQPGKAIQKVVVIRKHGQPLLVLGGNAWFCAQALALYPAQSVLARCMRFMLGIGLRFGVLFLFPREVLRFDPTDPFWKKILQYGRNHHNFAIFCGNPKAPGQRFMVLTGSTEQRQVIKVGVSPKAQELILQESEFLEKAQGCPYMPQMLERFQTEHVAGFSLPFIPGDSSSMDSIQEVASVMKSWILPEEMALNNIPMWKRLCAFGSSSMAILRKIEEHKVSATISHGDFAPWNIKVTSRGWIVLDWERGEKPGIPGWDWFHYLIQPRVLVLRQTSEQVLLEAEKAMDSVIFQDYAKKTKITEIQGALLCAYLEYMLRINSPTEGKEIMEGMHRIAFEKYCAMEKVHSDSAVSPPSLPTP